MLRAALAMARALRRLDAEVVHAHVFPSIIVGRVAGVVARTPVRVSMVPGPYQLEARALRAIDLATGWLEHRTIGGSRRVDDLYAQAGVPARRRRFVPYGADPSEFRPEASDPARIRAELGIDAEAPLIGQIAHFYGVPDGPFAPPATHGRGLKGHEDHLAAAALVLEERPDARFVFAGAGLGEEGEAHRADMVQRSHALDLEHAVSFLGPRSDVPDVLAALDVSVQCSLSENYGGTIESLLMERPTVATRVGGMPEVVRHERTGLLVAPRDPRALADAILRLIADRELGRRLGAAGRRLMLEAGYTTEACVDGIARVYSEMGMLPRLPLRPLNR
jgi:glycosyltransferase involved in cell wall biosynthesis